MWIDRHNSDLGLLTLCEPAIGRRLTGIVMCTAGVFALIGMVHVFNAPNGGHPLYGFIACVIGVPLVMGGAYAMLLINGVTLDARREIVLDWSQYLVWRDEAQLDLRSFRSIGALKCWSFDRATRLEPQYDCELRLQSTEGSAHDVTIARRIPEGRARVLCDELSAVLHLPVEWSSNGHRPFSPRPDRGS